MGLIHIVESKLIIAPEGVDSRTFDLPNGTYVTLGCDRTRAREYMLPSAVREYATEHYGVTKKLSLEPGQTADDPIMVLLYHGTPQVEKARFPVTDVVLPEYTRFARFDHPTPTQLTRPSVLVHSINKVDPQAVRAAYDHRTQGFVLCLTDKYQLKVEY